MASKEGDTCRVYIHASTDNDLLLSSTLSAVPELDHIPNGADAKEMHKKMKALADDNTGMEVCERGAGCDPSRLGVLNAYCTEGCVTHIRGG